MWPRRHGESCLCKKCLGSHKHQENDLETRLYVKPKGMIAEGYYGPNTIALTGDSYVVCEVLCRKCGRQIARRSIEVRPEDLEVPLGLVR